MNSSVPGRLLVALLAILLHSRGNAAVLTHRYSFDTDPGDQIGTAHGTLLGAAQVQEGALVLSGTNASMQLPANLLTNSSSLSLEMWYVDSPVNLTDAQLFYFSAANGQLYYSLSVGAFFKVGFSSSTTKPSTPPVALGGTNHLIWSFDGNSHIARLYLNGVLIDSNANCTNDPTMMGFVATSRIGGNSGSYFRGRILEFRIYEGALGDLDAACLEATGPDRLPVNPGMPEGLRINGPGVYAPNAKFGLHVLADFAGITNVDITTQPELILYSDDTNVVAVTPDRKLSTLAFGTTRIAATYLGLSNSVIFTVGVPRDFCLVHRYGFNEVTNDWILHDSVGNADGLVFNAKFSRNAVFTGKGELILNPPTFSGGYARLPAGIVSSLDEVTIEAWITWRTNTGSWQRIFDFGNSASQTYIYATPESGDNHVAQVSITTASVGYETRLRGANPISLNTSSFIAWVYSPVRQLARLYVNGEIVASFHGQYPLPTLSSIIDTNNWLGQSRFALDGYFCGRYNEFRIFRGALSDLEVRAEFAAGPDIIGADYVLRCQNDESGLWMSWGSSAGHYVLETSSTLGANAEWNAVLQTPTFATGRYFVTLPFLPESAFFRLRKP